MRKRQENATAITILMVGWDIDKMRKCGIRKMTRFIF